MATRGEAIAEAAAAAEPIFVNSGWTWMRGGMQVIPLLTDIEDAYNELRDCLDDGVTVSSSSGRLYVKRNDDGDIVYGISDALSWEDAPTMPVSSATAAPRDPLARLGKLP